MNVPAPAFFSPDRLRYWRFWWPLCLVGLALPLGRMVENAVLARFPDGTTELALFAYAQGTFFIPRSVMVFMPQLATVLGRNRVDNRRCRLFSILAGVVLAVPILFLAGPARPVLGLLYGLPAGHAERVATYLLWLAPLLFFDGFNSYTNGLLARHRRTGCMSLGTGANLVVLLVVVLAGLLLGWSPAQAVVGSMLAGAVVQTGVVWASWWRTPSDFEADPAKPLDIGAILRFFVPLSITSIMFACSRPTIYAIIGHGADAVVTVAALRVAFDLGMLFQIPVNQFRHLMVTFAAEDLPGVRRFMFRTMWVVTLIMGLTLAGPWAGWLLRALLGEEAHLAPLIREAWWVLLLVPVVVTWRNLHHGLAMVRRSTTVMAAASLLRVGLIALICAIAAALGLLDHIVGAAAMVAGFAIEAITVWWRGRASSKRCLS